MKQILRLSLWVTTITTTLTTTSYTQAQTQVQMPSRINVQDADTKTSIVGIGVVLGQQDNGAITVYGFVAGAPAERSGLALGDQIIAVKSHPDSEVIDIRQLPLEEIVNLIRGPVGIPVEITIVRGESELIVVSIIREKFVIEDKN